MTPDEKKRKFEEDIINMSVEEYYRYVDVYKKTRSEKDAKMFYSAFRLGVIKGINFATTEIALHNKQLDKEEQDGTKQD